MSETASAQPAKLDPENTLYLDLKDGPGRDRVAARPRAEACRADEGAGAAQGFYDGRRSTA